MKNIITKVLWFNVLKGYGRLLGENNIHYFLSGETVGGNIFGQNIPKQNIPRSEDQYLVLEYLIDPTLGSPFHQATKIKRIRRKNE